MRNETLSSLDLGQEIGNVIGVLQSGKIERGVVRVLPEIVRVYFKVLTESLAEAGIELIAVACSDRPLTTF